MESLNGIIGGAPRDVVLERAMARLSRELEMVQAMWDKHGRLWGHEWAAVAWMALAIAEARDDGGAVLLDPSVIRRWVTENLMSESDRDRMVYQGLE